MFGIKKLKKEVRELRSELTDVNETYSRLNRESSEYVKFELYKIKNPQKYNNGDVIEFTTNTDCEQGQEFKLKEGVVCSHIYEDGHSREMFNGFNAYLSFPQPTSFYTVKDIKDFNKEYEVNVDDITKLSNKKIKIK